MKSCIYTTDCCLGCWDLFVSSALCRPEREKSNTVALSTLSRDFIELRRTLEYQGTKQFPFKENTKKSDLSIIPDWLQKNKNNNNKKTFHFHLNTSACTRHSFVDFCLHKGTEFRRLNRGFLRALGGSVQDIKIKI